jgi:hypothetical protein
MAIWKKQNCGNNKKKKSMVSGVWGRRKMNGRAQRNY